MRYLLKVADLEKVKFYQKCDFHIQGTEFSALSDKVTRERKYVSSHKLSAMQNFVLISSLISFVNNDKLVMA